MEYRPDLKSPNPEARAIYALEDAARRIAQECQICHETTVPVIVPANTLSIVANPTLGAVIRILGVRIGFIPYPSTSLGEWDADENDPELADAAWPVAGSFYLVTTAGDTSLGGITTWEIGDILYSTGTSWKQVRLDQYDNLGEVNKPSYEILSFNTQSGRSTPRGYSQENGTIFLYDPPGYDCVIQIAQSITPSGELMSVEFPEEAEWVILDGARAYLLELPGELMNQVLAREYRDEFKKGRARLKSVGILGWGGMPEYRSGNFTGRLGGSSGGLICPCR
jgi:hypothetical protein